MPKRIDVTEAKAFDLNELEVMTISPKTAAAIIRELSEDLAGTGIKKLVLRASDGRRFAFAIEESR